MEARDLRKGEIVQINPEHNDGRDDAWFGGCLMVVTESKPWGAQGCVMVPGQRGAAYYSCTWEHMEPTGGTAPWITA